MVPGEHNAQLTTNLVDVFPEHLAVRTREVNELENALGLLLGFERLSRPNPPIVNNDEFPWLDVTNVFGADDVQRTGFAGDDGRITLPAYTERPERLRVANGDERFLRQQEDGERTPQLPHRVDDHRIESLVPCCAQSGGG